MTRRGYLVAATLWFCAVGVAWSLFWMRRADDSARTRMQQALWGVATRLLAAPGVAPGRTAPTVDPDRLMGHVRALAFERWTPADRARARGYLAHTLIELGHDPAQLAFAEGINLEVVRPGTDPTAGDVLLAAHYDSRHGSPGADDNATGVAVVLEAARLLRTPTPRGLRLVFFDAEERGLKGSLAYAQSPSRIKDLRAVVVLEMLGYACHTEGCQKHPEGLPLPAPTTGNFLAVVGDLEHIDLLRAFRGVERPAGGPGAVPIFALPVPGRGHALPDTRRSDHAPFWDQGIGAVMVTDTAELRNPHYHLPGDVPERLDGAFFTGAAQAVLDAVVHLTR
jgi:hypothetical protein